MKNQKTMEFLLFAKKIARPLLFGVVWVGVVFAMRLDGIAQTPRPPASGNSGAARPQFGVPGRTPPSNAPKTPPNALPKTPSPKTPPNRPPQSRGVPTPSALPSQRLASQAAKVAQGENRDSCLLKSARRVGACDIVEIELEGSGEIFQTSTSDIPSATATGGAPMEIRAGFKYEERTEENHLPLAPGGTASMASLRLYEQAGVKRNFGGEIVRLLLDSSRKHIISRFDGKSVTIYSPSGPLKDDQFLLLDELPGNSLLLDLLLPNKEVKRGEEWTVSDEVLRAFLGLEAIENNTLRLVLTAIIDDMAEVDLFLADPGTNDAGEPLPSTLQGASLGSSVAIDLQGKFQFDLKTNRMSWLGLVVAERRSESLTEPGLDWKGSLKIKVAPLAEPGRLDDALAAGLRIPLTDNLSHLIYSGQKGPWSFLHSRQWRMIEDGEKSAALSFLNKGDGISQCNILWGGKIDLASLPSMEAYKDELKKGLGERFGRFVHDLESTDANGCAVLEAIIDGEFEELPFRWIYYLITDPDGWQATIMFEVRADRLEEFGDSGREIVDSFRMIPPPEPANDPPASANSADVSAP